VNGQQRELIRSCAARIVANPLFTNADRLCRFLLYCVEHVLEERTDCLKETLIGMEVFDRGSAFDPRSDSIVRVDARRLRLKLEEYYRRDGRGDPVQIVLAPGGYVPEFRFRQQPPTPSATPSLRPASLAILPFLNLTSDPEMEYFSDGLTEEVIASLARVPGLRVVARTSVFQFKGVRNDIREIASRLNVEAVLEGGVRKSGHRLRVTAQLIAAADGCQVWSEIFDREAADMLVLQDDIARGICRRLGEQFPEGGPRPPRNPRAYQLYLKGRYLWNQLTPDSLRQAVSCFERSSTEDPAYASPHAGLACCFIILSMFGSRPQEMIPKARAAAEKALALDEASPEAHAALGHVKAFHDFDSIGAERSYRRALELDPGAVPIYEWYGKFLACYGRVDEALEQLRWAQSLDPVSPLLNANVALVLYVGRKYDEAIENYRGALAMDPNYYWTHWHLSMAYATVFRLDEAVAAGEKAFALSGGNTPVLGVLGLAHGMAGRRSAAERVICDLRARAEKEHVSPLVMALVYAGMGERTKAFEWLERGFQERNPLMLWITWPLFDSIRDDTRFEALLHRIGLQ
jgi:TolB-like protein/Flp pilus assembly protein TadD